MAIADPAGRVVFEHTCREPTRSGGWAERTKFRALAYGKCGFFDQDNSASTLIYQCDASTRDGVYFNVSVTGGAVRVLVCPHHLAVLQQREHDLTSGGGKQCR
jgi:hypothetical protein